MTDSVTPSSNHSAGIIVRLFRALARFVYSRPTLVVVLCFVAAALSLWITAERLTFHTSRSDLLPQDREYIHLYEAYREEFEDFDGMIIVVEGANKNQMKRATEALVQKMQATPDTFPNIFYKIDTEALKKSALLYMDAEELQDLAAKIRERQLFLEDLNARPGLNQLLKGVNAEISSGMVDSLLSDFIGSDNETDKDDSADLSLLIEIEKQMIERLQGKADYRSPWKAFLAGDAEGLKDEGYLTSDDESLLFILIVPNEETSEFTGFKDSMEQARALIKEVALEYPEVGIGLTGEDVIASDEMVATEADVRFASILSLVGVALLYIIFYGGVRKPLLAIVSLIIGISWSLGYASLAVGHLNILSVVFTTILIGLGVDFGIHLLERYREERAAGRDAQSALEIAMRSSGESNFEGAVAIGIAFGGLTITDFIGIAELGWIAGGGVFLCMVSMLVCLPALIALEEKFFKPAYAVSSFERGKSEFLNRLFSRYRLLIVVTLIATVALSSFIPMTKFDYNLLNLQAKNAEAVQYELKILEKANRSTWSAAVVVNTLEEAEEAIEIIERLPSVGRVESIASAVPENQEEKIEIVKSMAPLLESLEPEGEDAIFSFEKLVRVMKKISFKLRDREADDGDEDVRTAGRLARDFLKLAESSDAQKAQSALSAFSSELMIDYREQVADLQLAAHPKMISVDDLPSLLRQRFISKNGKYLISVFPKVNIWEREGMTQFLTELRGVDPKVTGNAVHVYESSYLMREGYVTGGLYALVGIIIYLFYIFRKPGTVLLTLLPVTLGSLWTAGMMPLFNLDFNLANLVILPLILGIGVVDGVHIIHRFREEGEARKEPLARSVANAVTLTSLTTMIGFGSLMTADHQGVYSLGMILALGVGNCMITSFTLLPALLKLCLERGWKV
ncbi:MAG: MMPL family transporter [Candidatus Nitrohelix vancouverensis]|uniref:MMPL family transporter n=1 Tax=Candidatus Nitrohelix vancouverensis TaxID=2705534 RepID=A0A7T0G2Y5_9BACT|nr:MAG: MMPL family transporter [Candidatus Nitrohelix vancouverensis]